MTQIDFRGVLNCAIVIAGLGVLNDVTVTQASAVWELRGASPHLSRRQLFTRAMRIVRDHIASTLYTIAFAYAGAAMVALIIIDLYNRPAVSLFS
ncbi:YibE/F family protein [Leifsonia sp. WHRI 6310E]|uniref:YibE/F family protein n=1 Tax=Leifsonia TaxID=110932 RepID=UPI0035A8B3FA